MGKSTYNSIDELPDLTQEPVHAIDPKTKKITTYKSIDDLPDLKKKPSSNDGQKLSEDGSSVTPKVDESIPTVSIEDKDIYENPIDKSIRYNDLANATKEVSMGAGGMSMGTGSATVPDEVKVNEAKKLNESAGDIDLHDLYNETKGLSDTDYGRKGFSKDELLKDREENNQLYHRKLGRLKWQSQFNVQLDNDLINQNITKDVYDGLKDNINASLQNASVGNFEQQRQNINSVASAIKEYGGENKDEILKNYAVEAAKVYGNSWKNGGVVATKESPESKYLTNPNAELGYQYLKDISPESAKQYERLFIDPKSIKDNPDAQKGYNHLMQTLEETGVNLQENAVNEELNNLSRLAKQNNGLTPEQLEQAKKLDAKKEELTKAKNELDSKYPERIDDKVDDAMTEILGQRLNWGNYAGGMAGKAFKNTGEGIWEAVSTPFMSDNSNTMRELALMGESKFDESVYKKSDKNKGLLTDHLVIEPELQKQIDVIKNDKNLTEEQKQAKLYPLLKDNTDKFSRVPIKGGQLDISPSSILYGVTDLGATLLPFIALETATAGVGGTSSAAKFLRTFTSAAATSFHDEYAAAVNSGKSSSEAYKEALVTTAINSAAMAGAGTAEKVKAMFGGNSSSAKIIQSMSDKEIESVLAKGTPKGLKAIKESLKGRLKQVPENFKQGLKTGAEFEAAMTGAKELTHQIYNNPIDREQNFKQSLLNIANFGFAGVIGGQAGYKSPTELQKSNIVKFGEKPDDFIAVAERMKKDGTLTAEEFDHRKDLIEKSAKAYQSLPKSNAKGKPLTEKEKGEYLYNSVIKNESKKSAADLPPKQAEKALHVSMVADYKNDILLDNPTDAQLESRKKTLEKQAEQKDENGKLVLNDNEIAKVKAQLDAIDETIEQRSKGVTVQPPMEVPEPITVDGKFKVPEGIEVQKPMNAPEPITIGEKNTPNEENKEAELSNAEKEANITDEGTDKIEQPAEGGGKEPPTEGEGIVGGNEGGITHAANAERRSEVGLGEYEKERESFEKWSKEADDLLAKGYDMEGLLKKMERKEATTEVENAIRKKYIATLDAQIEKNPTPELLAAKTRYSRIQDASNSAAGRQLVSLKGMEGAEDNLSNFLRDEANIAQVETLPQERINVLKKEYEADKEVIRKLNERVAALEEARLIKETNETLTKQSKSTKRVNKDFKAERQSLKDKLKAQFEEYKAAGQKMGIASDGGVESFKISVDMAKTIGEFVKSYLDEGAVKLEEVVKRVHEELKDFVSERDVRDVISGKYAEKKKSRSETAMKMQDLRTQQKLTDKLAQLQAGEKVAKDPLKKQRFNEEIDKVRKQIEQFHANEKKVIDDMKAAEKEAADKIKQAKKEEQDLIKEFENEKNVAKKKQLNAKVQEAKRISKELNKKTPEEVALQSYKTGLKNKIDKLKKDLDTGDFLKEPEPKKPLKLDPEAEKLLDEHIRFVKETALRRAKAEFDNRAKGEKLYDYVMQVLSIKRIVQTAIDLSIPFRQGVTIAFNPRRWDTFGKSFKTMIQSVLSSKKFDRIMYDIHQSKDYQNMLKDNVHFNEMDAVDSNSRNEDFQKSFAYKIPIIKHLLLGSNRAADGFLNVSRYDMYMKGKSMLERQGLTRENSPESYEALGKWVMNITGRGNLIKFLEDSHNGRIVASNTFFGARLMASRFNLLNPMYYKNMPKAVRVEALKDMGTYIGMISATLLAATAAGYKVTTDPDDPDFLKIKNGNTRYDITGGMVQYLRTYMRLEKMVVTKFDSSKSSDEKKKYAAFAMKSLVSFFRYKLAPNTSYGLNAAYGEDALGNDFDPSEAAKIYPMYVDDMRTAYKEGGIGMLAAVGIPSLLGVGVQTYEAKPKKAAAAAPKAPKPPHPPKPKHYKSGD